MDNKTVATLLVTVLVATTGYLVKYINDLRIARRKDQLDRINHQLGDLYGPLLALNKAARETWIAFRKTYRADVFQFWDTSNPPTEAEAAAWRLWMVEVFAPINRRMMEAVLTHADLIDAQTLPPSFMRLFVHVMTYAPILERWKSGDYTEHRAAVNFPGSDFSNDIEAEFDRLKGEQQKRLRQRW